jgi:hypothetical protein
MPAIIHAVASLCARPGCAEAVVLATRETTAHFQTLVRARAEPVALRLLDEVIAQ